MNNCPICSGKALRHVGRNKVYWYCPHCHETVPNLTTVVITQRHRQPETPKIKVPVTIGVRG